MKYLERYHRKGGNQWNFEGRLVFKYKEKRDGLSVREFQEQNLRRTCRKGKEKLQNQSVRYKKILISNESEDPFLNAKILPLSMYIIISTVGS